jgi:hypothetical protein
MAPRLQKIAEAINEKAFGYTATVRPTWSSTDRKVGRLRVPGKGRKGFEIKVVNLNGDKLFEYDTSVHPYRTNHDAAEAISAIFGGPIWLPGVMPKPLTCWKCRAKENLRTRGKFTQTWQVFGPVLCPRCKDK